MITKDLIGGLLLRADLSPNRDAPCRRDELALSTDCVL
jgi:hypothetical protein